MIVARKNVVLERLLYAYFRWLARGAFHTIVVRGLDRLRELPADRPALFFCTHTNWWDGLVCFLLSREMAHRRSYCMMEEKQLREFRFFTWLGAFSVDPGSPRRAAVSLRYARRLLEDERAAVWIFPQGRLCRPDEPFVVQPGTAWLARSVPGVMLVPVALRFEFFREDRPHVLIEVGEPFGGVGVDDARIAREGEAALGRVGEAARAQDLAGFGPVLAPRWAVNKRWEWVRRAVTGRLDGFTPTNEVGRGE